MEGLFWSYKLNNGIAWAEGYLHGFYFLKWSNYYGLSISELIFSKQSFSAFYFYGRLFYDFSIVKNWEVVSHVSKRCPFEEISHIPFWYSFDFNNKLRAKIAEEK